MGEALSENHNGNGLAIVPDCKLDITSFVCPMTFVKTKLQLEDMDTGQTLGLRIRLGESYNNVTRSVRDEGHKIIGERPVEDHVVELFIEKGKD